MLFAHWGYSRSNDIIEFFLVFPPWVSIPLTLYDKGAIGITCSRQPLLTNIRMASLPQWPESLYMAAQALHWSTPRATIHTDFDVNGFSRSYAIKRHWTALSSLLGIRSNPSFPLSLPQTALLEGITPSAVHLPYTLYFLPCSYCFTWIAYLVPF